MDDLELWIDYRENYNLEARDALIEKYMSYCYSIGLRIYRRYSDFVNLDKDEIFGITSFSLIKAIEAYDHTKGVPFIKFLSKVMKWYIKQELSKYMNISIRDQLKIFKKISENKNNEMLQLLISLSYRNMYSLNHQTHNNLSIQNILKDNSIKPEENVELKEVFVMLIQAIENILSHNEKTVLKKIYYENKKLSVVSEEMNLSKQRINQIHRSAIKKIRNFIKNKISH
ncbi:MAG: sigma-70 family RNA polymerase sigma factor [Candidatus Calescibacterium sp.]|nr:sigma-70 family RNA polymerase sigma factor [Candidatus Calescibacterium sp.]MCX7972474.1 sigma-70 family RNA polymerase sigma factor [bacterium]MDW8195634.1 sigma-70 family RNA polymerase sigma factor [Candidatus Calescibacterium sp.]